MIADDALPWIVGAFGLVFGSFLNVCIYRLPVGLSIVMPPSRCSACGHTLSWFENIPLVSYLVLRGRCRACGVRISWQYPLVETATALVFLASLAVFGPDLLLVSRLVFASALIVLFVIDLRHRILPNAITLPGIVVGFAFSLFTDPGWQSSLLGIVLGGGALWLMFELWLLIRHEEGLGFGDVKMLAMIGAFLGWRLMLLTLVLASLAGSIVGIALMATGKGGWKSALPLGTFLALAAIVAMFVGDAMIRWYLGFYP